MFERGFTQRTFRNGINKYINRHVSKSQRQDIKQLIHETLNSTLSSLRGQPYSSGKGKSDHLSKRIQPKKIEKTPKDKPAAAEPSAGAPLGEKQYAGKARDASGWKKVNPRKVTAAETGTKVPEGLTKFGVARRKDDRTCYVSTLVTLLQCSALRNNGIFNNGSRRLKESNPLVKGFLTTAVNTDKANNFPDAILDALRKRRTVQGDPIELLQNLASKVKLINDLFTPTATTTVQCKMNHMTPMTLSAIKPFVSMTADKRKTIIFDGRHFENMIREAFDTQPGVMNQTDPPLIRFGSIREQIDQLEDHTKLHNFCQRCKTKGNSPLQLNQSHLYTVVPPKLLLIDTALSMHTKSGNLLSDSAIKTIVLPERTTISGHHYELRGTARFDGADTNGSEHYFAVIKDPTSGASHHKWTMAKYRPLTKQKAFPIDGSGWRYTNVRAHFHQRKDSTRTTLSNPW